MSPSSATSPLTSGNTPPRSAPGADFIDPRALMRIKTLELRARVVVEGFWKGIHRSPHHGFSVEFTEYRQYTPGDDPRYLDWRLYARSDRYFIKKFEDETNLRCQLLVDRSRSMTFGSPAVGHSKADYAATLAATLAYFLFGQGDAVGLMSFDQRVSEYLPARNRPGHLRHLMLALEKPAGGTSTDLLLPLRRLSEMLNRRGMLVLISDLLAPVDQLGAHLGYLRARGHEVVIFQTLDPAELSLDLDQPALIQDVETGREVYIDPAQARAGYQQKLQAHLASITAACANLGIDHHLCRTDRPLELALFDFLTDRARRGRHVQRAAASRSGGGRP